MGSGWLRVGIANINGSPDFGEWFQILAAHQRESLVGVGMANAGESLLGGWETMEGNCWETLVRDGKYYGGGKYCWEVGGGSSKK